MADELLRWVENRLREGWSKDRIRDALRQEGYNRRAIEDVLQRAAPVRQRETGFFSWWWSSVTGVLERPSEFFRSRSMDRWKQPTLFLFVTALLFRGLAALFIVGAIFTTDISSLTGSALGMGATIIAVLVMVNAVLSTIGNIIGNILLAAYFQGVYRLMGGRGSMAGNYGVFSYSYAAAEILVVLGTAVVSLFLLTDSLLVGILFLPLLLLPLYALYIQLTGFAAVQQISRLKAFVPYVVFSVLLVVAVSAIGLSTVPADDVNGPSAGGSPFDQCVKVTPRFSGQAVAIDSWAFTGTNAMSVSLQSIYQDINVTDVDIDFDDDGSDDVDDTSYAGMQLDAGTTGTLSLNLNANTLSSGACARGDVSFTYDVIGGASGRQATGSGNIGGPVP